MLSQRWRPVFLCVAAVVVIWVVALLGYRLARNARMTPEKIKAYMESVDLTRLSASARAKAIQELADKINALSAEEQDAPDRGKPVRIERHHPIDRGKGHSGAVEKQTRTAQQLQTYV